MSYGNLSHPRFIQCSQMVRFIAIWAIFAGQMRQKIGVRDRSQIGLFSVPARDLVAIFKDGPLLFIFGGWQRRNSPHHRTRLSSVGALLVGSLSLGARLERSAARLRRRVTRGGWCRNFQTAKENLMLHTQWESTAST